MHDNETDAPPTPYFVQRPVDTARIMLSTPRPATRALQWAMALDLLDVQIHALPHAPERQHALSVVWEILERLRREDTSP